jgi:hypothetical protein
MCVRALGLIGDKAAVPDLIHLVYHGNVNTRWWAQISLVRITGQNFGGDWNAWGKWWNEQIGPLEAETERQIQGQLIQATAELTQFEVLHAMTAEKRRDAIQHVFGPDTELSGLLSELNTARANLDAARKDYAPEHPTYRSLQNQVDEADKRIDKRIKAMMQSLPIREAAQRAAAAKLQTILDNARLPPFNPGIIRWWDGQAEPDKLASSLDESDQKFLESIKPK